ncbi:hypothetical protein P7L87_26640, partial [Vibrio parahaemolyticus]|nr:hypothetical protein [Vibrio parahaemolyticus]
NVARVKAGGLPTTHLLDRVLFQTNWFKTIIVATGQRIDSVKAVADNASAAVTTEQQARVSADAALALRIDTVEAYAGDATAQGQIYFAAKAAPAGAIAAYGLYLTAGNAYAGMDVLADSGGGGSIAFTANDFKLTDSGTAQNVFNYTGGIFTFNVPVRIGTVDILEGAVNAPVAVANNNARNIASTSGWETILTVTAVGEAGYVAVVYTDFEYKVDGGSGVLDGSFRIRRSDGVILREGNLYPYAEYVPTTIARLDASFTQQYSYELQVNISFTVGSGSPYVAFRRRGMMIDIRKR